MKKSLYLKLSQQEANKRIWDSLFEKHEICKQKHKILGYLYIPIAFIAFGSIAVVSFFSRISLFFKDVRFTPHYMQTVITHNNMSAEQANEYLISQQQEYKKSLSYGNFSTQQRDSINTTFELLFNEYKLPEPEDKKHREIITSLLDVKNISLESNKGILELNSSVDSLSSSAASQSNSIAEAKQSIEENGATIQASISDLSTLVTENKENITSQIQNQNNLFREELSKTNDKILESADVLLEQNNIIKTDITIISQSVDNIHSTIANSTNNINELSSQVTENESNTQKLLSNIDSNVEGIKSTIEPVALYTKQKQQQEEIEEKRVDKLRESQEKRKTTAYNREKGKKLTSFESALTEKQITILVDYCNKIAVFERDVEFQEMKNILLCSHTKPLKVTINKYVAFLFTELSKNNLICKTWKSVAERYECFVSSENKVLNSNDLYMANQTSGLMEQKAYDLIVECIEAVCDLD